MSCVYLLHIDPPYKGYMKHYTGFSNADTPDKRVKQHVTGAGGKFTSRVVKAGCKLTLAHYWPNANEGFERFVKDHVSTKTQCPICGGVPMEITDPDYLSQGNT